MAGLLKAAASALHTGLRSGGSGALRQAAQHQQKRGAHELHAHTNKHIEKWLSRREDIENEFVWNTRHTIAVLIGGIGMPIATYNMLVYMAHQGEPWVGWASVGSSLNRGGGLKGEVARRKHRGCWFRVRWLLERRGPGGEGGMPVGQGVAGSGWGLGWRAALDAACWAVDMEVQRACSRQIGTIERHSRRE